MGPFGCVSADTKVMTEYGPKPIQSITSSMRVLSWDGEKGQFALSQATGAFPKGRDYLYRVVTTRGEFDASGHHQMLCADGNYRRVDTLDQGQSVFQCLHDPRQTSSSMFLRSLPLDEPRYSERVVDCLDRYGSLARQYGQQLLMGRDTALASSPLQGGAQTLFSPDDLAFVERMGGFVKQSQEHTRLNQPFYQKQTGGYSDPSEHHVSTLADHVSSLPFLRSVGLNLQSLLYQTTTLYRQIVELFSKYSHSFNRSLSKGTILSVTKKKYKEVYWDMQVPDTNNYVLADGTIHHNSGKSVMMVWEIFMRAKAQTPSNDGIRRSRWIIARNTQPQLETTTIKTWLDWFPESTFGKMSRKPPFTHKVSLGDIELEVIFLALDKPEDVKKLLSFEVTGVFFNEAREMEYEVIAGATGRVGRYPPKKDKPDHIPDDQWPKWSGIIMDTNPPTDDHWWFKMAEEQAWAVDKYGNPTDADEIPENMSWAFWKQPSGLAKDAENIDNLPGGKDYYTKQLGGKTEEWINVYVHGNYGFIKSGLPVYKNSWNPDIHSTKEDISTPAGGTIYTGIDASGRHPAAVFIYCTMPGQLQVLHELCVTQDEGMGAVAFARLIKQEMALKLPNPDFDIWGDAAGAWALQNDARTYFDILRG